MSNATIRVPLGGKELIVGALLATSDKLGRVTFNFQNDTDLGQRFGQRDGGDAVIQLAESDDGGKTSSLLGDPVTIRPGGELHLPVITQKTHLLVLGKQTGTGGGYIRADISHKGVAFRGDIAIDPFGKRAFIKDFDGSEPTAGFAAEGAPGPWPE